MFHLLAGQGSIAKFMASVMLARRNLKKKGEEERRTRAGLQEVEEEASAMVATTKGEKGEE